MLAKRADADARDERGFTPLLTACWHGNAAAVETLIRTTAPRRLNLDASTDTGRSPLHAACWRGGFSCAAALLDAGADRRLHGRRRRDGEIVQSRGGG